MTEKRSVSYDDWITEGTKEFGLTIRDWVFKCPSCGQSQTGAHFARLRMAPKDIDKCIGRVCIGYVLRRKGHDKVVEVGERSQGAGCVMTYKDGLLPVTVVHGPGNESEVMEWA